MKQAKLRSKKYKKVIIPVLVIVAIAGLATLYRTIFISKAADSLNSAGYNVKFPEQGVLWGIYRSPYNYADGNFTLASQQNLLLEAQTSIGRKYDRVRFYAKWNETPINDFLKWSSDQGQIPFLSIEASNTNGSLVRWNSIGSKTST